MGKVLVMPRPDEPPQDKTEPPAELASVAKAASSENRRETLVALRDRLARTIDSPRTAPRDLAALSRRVMDIISEIEAIDQAKAGEDHDGVSTEDEGWKPI